MADGRLTTAMVDRLFWRAGFGPSPADRARWTDEPVDDLIDYFLTAPYELVARSEPSTYAGKPIDPLGGTQPLQLEWLDRMVRVANPLPERLCLFWHGHFCVSRLEVPNRAALVRYRDRLLRFSDLGGNPAATFRDLALEMTTQDLAMNLYLTLSANTKAAPNENYAREFMELFTLGLTDAAGDPTYSQADVRGLARAFTGWRPNHTTLGVDFNPKSFDAGTKTILGRTGAFGAADAVSIVLSQPSHAPFLVTMLWNEFIPEPIPADALADLVAVYTGSGLQLAPLIRGILGHPLLFASLDEPTMIKSPVVYTVGVIRSLGVPIRDARQIVWMGRMQQELYAPPNVDGWPGGKTWMTGPSATARFNLIRECQWLLPNPLDEPTESAKAVVDRAERDCGSPWMSDETRKTLFEFSRTCPDSTATARRSRYLTLCELMLGGPDGQVC